MEVGQVVLSKQGRDQGNYFFIVKIDDSKEYVFIADGDMRKIENPKKKKVKHITLLHIDEIISDKLKNGTKVSNADLRKSLKSKTFEG